jgi:hypothetical protein
MGDGEVESLGSERGAVTKVEVDVALEHARILPWLTLMS